MNNQFIADVHLGKLARMLHMLGFDVLYHNAATPPQLLETAQSQNRILLSRYAPFAAMLPGQVVTIFSAHPEEQLQQVIDQLQLADKMQPFTRCLVCNGHLQPVPKSSVETLLEPNTRAAFQAFWQCTDCNRIYWKGSHYERMLKLVHSFSTAKAK